MSIPYRYRTASAATCARTVVQIISIRGAIAWRAGDRLGVAIGAVQYQYITPDRRMAGRRMAMAL